MKITKNPALLGLVLFIAMLTYSLILFIVVDDRNTNFWLGFGFTIVAFLLQVVADMYAIKSTKVKDVFMGLPIEEVGTIYLLIQIVLGITIIFIPIFNTTLAIVLSILVLAAFLIVFILLVVSKDVIENVDAKVRPKTNFIKLLLVDVELLRMKIEDPILKKQMKSLEESIVYSDPMSHGSLITVENMIEAKVAQLTEINDGGNLDNLKVLIREIELLIAERNMKCKALK